MKIPIYHVDTFCEELFLGNPAAVCILEGSLPNEILQKISAENNLPVTAFLMRLEQANTYKIWWFTPEYELDLCGHGSLAAAHVIFNILKPNLSEIKLQSTKELLTVSRKDSFIVLDFPMKDFEICAPVPALLDGLGVRVKEIYQHLNERYLAVLQTETEVKKLHPNMLALKELKHRGIIVTAPGDTCDFVSRTFYPHKAISEDPVTGASHCLLAPYWSRRLHKQKLHAKQVSERGGDLLCELVDERVLISGKSVLYMEGMITQDSHKL
jgi:PhzF family phenazine biosynthesis protein